MCALEWLHYFCRTLSGPFKIWQLISFNLGSFILLGNVLVSYCYVTHHPQNLVI